MAKDRAKDDRRSVGSHNKMTAALGRAAGWKKSQGYALPDKGVDGIFKPGHGHVNTGRADYYDRDRLASPLETFGKVEATKGLDNTAHGRPENKLPKKGKGRPDTTGLEDAEIK